MSWATDLACEIRNSHDGDTITVDSEAKRELAERAATRLHKNVIIHVEDEKQ